MDNYLIFDVSSPTLFYCGKTDNEFFVQKEFCKGKMNRELPGLIEDIKKKLNLETKILIGTGPGSFTGLKTGISMFIGMLYSLGIKKIHTVSSLKLFSLLCEKNADITLAVSPFNREEFFFAVFDRNGHTVFPDIHTRPPYTEFDEITNLCRGKTLQVVNSGELGHSIKKLIDKSFDNHGYGKLTLSKDLSFETAEQLDITKDPLLLNYVAYPANISENTDIYVNNNERVT